MTRSEIDKDRLYWCYHLSHDDVFVFEVKIERLVTPKMIMCKPVHESVHGLTTALLVLSTGFTELNGVCHRNASEVFETRPDAILGALIHVGNCMNGAIHKLSMISKLHRRIQAWQEMHGGDTRTLVEIAQEWKSE